MKRRRGLRAKSQLLRLLRYAWPQWRALLLVLASTMGGVLANLARPWPLKLLIDHVLGKQPLPASLHQLFLVLPGPHDRAGLLVWVCLTMVVITFGGIVVQIVYTLASTVFNQRVTYALGADLFLHVQRLSLLFHGRQPVGDTVARVTGDPNCVQQLIMALLSILQSAVMLISSFVIL